MGDRIASFLFDHALYLMPAIILACVAGMNFIVRRWPARIGRRIVAATLSLVLVAIAVGAGTLLYAERNIRSIIEHRVRVLTLHPVSGGAPAKVAELRGKVVLVNFWATWCPPCRAELPDMNRLADHYRSSNVSIVTITDEPPGQVQLFERKVMPLRTVNATFESDRPHGSLASAAYSGRPTTIVLDAGGRVRDIYIGKQSFDTLRRAIDRQLRQL